ncbi:MAG: NusG domain II-containing protein [Erysipelotrichia bacterium]|nr:NusG domain II-containing protein [Erysipelotrichia bacterium]
MFKKKADFILIITLILLALGSYLICTIPNGEPDKVVVRVDGEITDVFLLEEDGTYSLSNGTNILVIEDGKAWLEDADCPDKLCVKQGKISKVNQCITCLPNKLTVTIEGKNSDVDLIN